MKIFNKIVAVKLKVLAKLILKVQHPFIIAITGSLGKTSTKAAIETIFKGNFNFFSSGRSYNTEFGLPLTIMQAEMPENLQNVLGWIKVFFKGAKKIFSRNYPEILILEMGADAPGDIDYLLSIAKPDITVITGIAPVHLEGFKDEKVIFEEKSKTVVNVPKARAILNIDFKDLKRLAEIIPNEKITYGINSNANVTVFNLKNSLQGIAFKLIYNGHEYPVRSKLFGEHSIYSLLAAFAVGVAMEIDPEEIVKKLEGISAFPGRMDLLKGVNGSYIIDDSYNSSPYAAEKALDSLKTYKGINRIIVVLGSMNELGAASEEAHKELGRQVAKTADILITVGEEAEKWLAPEAIKNGLNKKFVHSFKEPFSAGEFLKQMVKKDDIILIKGSQNNVYTEEVTKQVIYPGLYPKDILVRQSADWLLKKKALMEKFNVK
ncbi:MAG: UDP-N-acetylmuramoyl-tripeptide--D-alanyl-D-alanine ligase [Patescibacteria group bacterium]|nr:UDP-N-acetylmuramoyl-tripeptide--D-alanyl-D-alanine ligase [Patescibacteria group bacterium]